MKSNIFIPQQINVGFRERKDTYTGKLAYIVYFDEKGKLRKETSWNGWRDKNIENQIYENTPTSGFVLNKKAGGYSTGWNHRQTYVRVYDPRGFEFEINVANLLYILENTNSIKGKGLEGEFTYGWDGKDLVLVPTESPDYIEISKLNSLRYAKNFVKAKDLKIGGTYLNKDGIEYIYMGKFDEYRYGEKKKGKSFFFCDRNREYSSFETMRTTSQRLVDVVSEDCAEDYAELFDKLENQTIYSPVDDSKDEYVPLTKEELEEIFNKSTYKYVYVLGALKGKVEKNYGNRVEIRNNRDTGEFYYQYENPNYRQRIYWSYPSNNDKEPYYLKVTYQNLDELITELKPSRKRKYLANGKLYSEGY